MEGMSAVSSPANQFGLAHFQSDPSTVPNFPLSGITETFHNRDLESASLGQRY